MIESVDPVYGPFPGPHQDLARSLSSLDAMASRLLHPHLETACSGLHRPSALSLLTSSAHTGLSLHRQKPIQYP